MQKTITFFIAFCKLIRTLLYIGIVGLIIGIMTGGPGDGIKTVPFTIFTIAVIAIFIISHVLPLYLEKKWPKEATRAKITINKPL